MDLLWNMLLGIPEVLSSARSLLVTRRPRWGDREQTKVSWKSTAL